VVQIPEVDGTQLRLRTLLLHSSGQSLDCGTLAAEIDTTNPQKAGACITYFRRYSLAAISQTVADEDTDAQDVAAPPAKKPAAKKAAVALTGHEVVSLQQDINACETTEQLSALLKGAAYQALKSGGPPDVYEQTSKLAKAKHALLVTPPAEQAGEHEDEPKPF
jgi:hypothetical protein